MSQPKTDFENAVEQVEKNTVTHLYPLWMNNWAENLCKARKGLSLDRIYAEPPVERALIVGRGPSLRKARHLEFLAENKFPGAVVASDGGLPLLLEHGIDVHSSITVDGSPIIAKWYIGNGVGKSNVRAILPLTVHPDTVKACEDNGIAIHWYIPELDAEKVKVGVTDTLQLQTYSSENPTGISRLNGAGCSGNASILYAAIILRAKEIVLVGFNGGYLPDTPLEQLHYHNGILRSCGYKDEDAAKLYKVEFYPVWGTSKYCILDPVFSIYKNTFISLSYQLKNMGIKLYNCTEGGCFVADPVTCMSLKRYYAEVLHAK